MSLLKFAFVLVCITAGKYLFCQVSIHSAIEHIMAKEYTSLEKLYEQLHQNPELSFKEEKTSAALAAELRRLNFTVTENIGGYGVVGVLKNGAGPVVLVRTDMDALPVKEETGVVFSSSIVTKDESGKDVPVMHACGHDMHMAVWTGVARVLSQLKKSWKGTVILIAQPAEERGAGALAMLNDGLFTKFPVPDYALALHVNSYLQSGKVGYCPGYALANIDMIDITVKGRGGHGAMPQTTIDPVVLASKLVLGFQTIVSREIPPLEPAVITVGAIHGGSKGNIIPAEVKLELTIRSFNDDIQKQLIAKIKRTCEGIALASGLLEEDYPVVTIRNEYTPSVYNDPALAEKVAVEFNAVLGEENVTKLSPEMFGEDFGRYGRQKPHVPVLMYSLGTVPEAQIKTAEEGKIILPSTHSALYFPDTEKSLKTGVLTMSSAVIFLLNEKQAKLKK